MDGPFIRLHAPTVVMLPSISPRTQCFSHHLENLYLHGSITLRNKTRFTISETLLPHCKTISHVSTNKNSTAPTSLPTKTTLSMDTTNNVNIQENSPTTIQEFLETLDIDTKDVEALTVPSDLDEMQERLEFLLNNVGLSLDDIKNNPQVLGCSVKKNMVPILNFLRELGVKKPGIPQILSKYPRILHLNIDKELNPLMSYLTGIGLTYDDLVEMVDAYPQILGFEIEGTISTTVAYLVGMGVHTRAIARMIRKYPPILSMRVGTTIKPLVDYLVTLGLEKHTLAKILEKKPYILGLGHDVEGKVKGNLESLEVFGLEKKDLGSMVWKFPDILGYDLKMRMTLQFELFQDLLGVDGFMFGKLVRQMPQIVTSGPGVVLKRIALLRGWGFTMDDLSVMIVGCPYLLVLDELSMELAFNFFMNEIEGDSRELVEFPRYFTYNLEMKVKPRLRNLKRRGLQCKLSLVLDCDDEVFDERLNADFIGVEELEPLS